MTLRLIFKQAYQYFKNKSLLYLTFIPFLILTVSLLVGMFSFAYNFQQTFNQVLGHNHINFKLYLNRPFKPAWIGDEKDDYFLLQEQVNSTTQQGYFYHFMTKLYQQGQKETLPTTAEYQLLILGLGYFRGEANQLSVSDLLTNVLLKQHFEVANPEQMDEHLKTYNQQAKVLGWKIYHLYQTNNLVIGYFLDFIQKDNGWLGYSMQEYWNAEFIAPSVKEKIYWQHLKVSPDLISENIDPTFYQETPWTLKTNPASSMQVQKQVNWKNNLEFLKNRNFVYFSPKFLYDHNLNVGDTISLDINLQKPDQPIKTIHSNSGQEFLIAGSMVSESNFDKKKPIFFIPYQWITKYYQEHNLMPRNVRGRIYAHLQEFGNDWQSGQKFASKLFNDRFVNLKDPKVMLETETEWAHWLPGYVYQMTSVLFLVLAYFVSFLMLVLLGIVFYFITQQIVAFQQQTLMFLKSLGTSNHQLSFLITATLMIPLLMTIIAGFFGGLIIQQMTANLALGDTALYWSYFQFSPVFFLVWVFSIIGLSTIFYLINWMLIRKQQLTSQGCQAVKTVPKWWTNLKLKLPKTWSPRFKIGLSFAFKNLFQNLITYLLLSLTFAITLYAVQFKTSLKSLGQAYQRWNQPYQSVSYNPKLYLYSPTENQQLLRTYQSITKTEDLIPITNSSDWDQAFNQYLESVRDNSFTFNWENYYLTKEFSLAVLNLINDQEKFDEFVKELRVKLNELWDNPEEVNNFLVVFLNLVNQLKVKIDNLNQEFSYTEGFNLYFGQVPLLINNRNVWATETYFDNLTQPISLIAFKFSDSLTQKHFGFASMNRIKNYVIKNNFDSSKNLLRINISNYLATENNFHEGQILKFKIVGLKENLTSEAVTIQVLINKIIQDNNVTSQIYTCQEGLIYYLTQMSNLDQPIKVQYQELLSALSNQTDDISNSVYDQNNEIPWGIQNLTLPIYHAVNADHPGTRIQDFYDASLNAKYFENLGTQIIIFSAVSQKTLKSSQQFMEILDYLIVIFILLSVIISAILTNLILFENQRIIILLKSIGYHRREVESYLITGYLVATWLAVGTGLLLSFLIFQATKQILTPTLGFSIYFIWSWQYILTFIGLGLIFWLMVKVTINFFTHQQKPTDLFQEY